MQLFERLWRRNKLTINRDMYVEQCKHINSLLFDSKMKFYSNLIKTNNKNNVVLFSALDKMLNKKASKKLPSHDCPVDLANKFADFFTCLLNMCFPVVIAPDRMLCTVSHVYNNDSMSDFNMRSFCSSLSSSVLHSIAANPPSRSANFLIAMPVRNWFAFSSRLTSYSA